MIKTSPAAHRRNPLKKVLHSIVQGLSIEPLFRMAVQGTVCIFLYHDVTDHPRPFSQNHDLNVPPDLFETQLLFIKRYFNMITPQQLLDGAYATPAALISFDDGMASYFENAVPILTKHQCPSLMFMNMEPVAGSTFWSGLLVYLYDTDSRFLEFMATVRNKQPRLLMDCSPEDVESYLDSSLVDRNTILEKARRFYGSFATPDHLTSTEHGQGVFLGNHLYNHYSATGISPERLRYEYLKNQELLAKYTNSIDAFSYTFGYPCYNDGTHAALRQAGARNLFISNGGVNMPSRKAPWDRLGMDERIQTEKQFRTHLLKAILAPPVRTLLRALKQPV